jgi:hypothetical protein
MRLAKRLLYSSPNGDRWFLVRDPNGRISILHEPNAASGGQASDSEIGMFLIGGRSGPEHQELRRLIGTLVDEPSSDAARDRDEVLEPNP